MTIQTRSVELLDAIRSYDYYQHLLDVSLARHHLTEELIRVELVPDAELCSLWNTMWGLLPDHPAIQRQPFYALCDLCEYLDDFDTEL